MVGRRKLTFSSVREYTNYFSVLIEREGEEQIKAVIEEVKRISGKEREKRGKAILGVSGKFLKRGVGDVLIYRFSRKREIRTEIAVGDVVIVSKERPKGTEPQGTVVAKGKHFIDVAFESRLPSKFLKDVRIDLWTNDITFRRMKEALRRFEKLGEGGWELCDILLGKGKPEWEDVDVNSTFYCNFLNESQKSCVFDVLRAKHVFLIHGPPGTGKTTTVACAIAELVKQGKKILATAETNVAVDNLVEKLLELQVDVVRIGNPARVMPHLVEATCDAKVEMDERWKEVLKIREKIDKLKEERENYQKPIPSLRRGLSDDEILELSARGKAKRGLSQKVIKSMARWIEISREIERMREKAQKIERQIVVDILKRAQVVVSTNSGAGIEELDEVEFDVVFVDEGSCATEPSALIPATRGRKLVMAGDHKQLPPVVLGAKELEFTLFERLFELYPEFSRMLEVQYRANELIMEFSNVKFYGGKLRPSPSVAKRTLNIIPPSVGGKLKAIFDKEPLVWIKVLGEEEQKRGSTSFFNESEAQVVVKVLKAFLEAGISPKDIGVISPYDDQIKLILELCEGWADEVEVKTVDGFQGREKEVIIISFVRTKRIGFLEDERRLNVALTRARSKLIVISSPNLQNLHPLYRELAEWLSQKAKVIEL